MPEMPRVPSAQPFTGRDGVDRSAWPRVSTMLLAAAQAFFFACPL
jgi:hypothetical protein